MIKWLNFKYKKIGDIKPCGLKSPVQPQEKLEFNEFWHYIYNANKKYGNIKNNK